MSKLISNSAILVVLMFLDTVDQINCQLISKKLSFHSNIEILKFKYRFYDKIIPLLFHHLKVKAEKYIIRRSSDHLKYILYNMSNAQIDIYGNRF